MALERDDAAERLARIDKLIADMKPTRAEHQITRLQTPSRSSRCPKAPRSLSVAVPRICEQLQLRNSRIEFEGSG